MWGSSVVSMEQATCCDDPFAARSKVSPRIPLVQELETSGELPGRAYRESAEKSAVGAGSVRKVAQYCWASHSTVKNSSGALLSLLVC